MDAVFLIIEALGEMLYKMWNPMQIWHINRPKEIIIF